jgi:hypothetical protein|uniref:Uncharacterized protein n=3 Tax=Oryza TaxID=4527 RepID=Q6ZI93_ORYSJ|nr:hypothetical protein [Oryza sativa Japonica Group]BAD33314.1 hypothetical protein [Oryza sativa Japonica Group]
MACRTSQRTEKFPSEILNLEIVFVWKHLNVAIPSSQERSCKNVCRLCPWLHVAVWALKHEEGTATINGLPTVSILHISLVARAI